MSPHEVVGHDLDRRGVGVGVAPDPLRECADGSDHAAYGPGGNALGHHVQELGAAAARELVRAAAR